MNKNIKEKFPSWCNDMVEDGLCMTDDLDSLLSCVLLLKVNPRYEINRFYTFSDLYNIKGMEHLKRSIGVDMDLLKGRCWGNHVVKINSYIDIPLSANINNINNITMGNYTKKYCGSTVLEIISYYNMNIKHLSDLGKKLLLCIDSTFLSYFFNKDTCKKYLVEQMELEELYSILENTSKGEFFDLKTKYNLNAKIFVQNGKLKTDLDLEGLSKIFKIDLTFLRDLEIGEITAQYDNLITNIGTPINYSMEDIKGVFSMAITNKTTVKYSNYK